MLARMRHGRGTCGCVRPKLGRTRWERQIPRKWERQIPRNSYPAGEGTPGGIEAAQDMAGVRSRRFNVCTYNPALLSAARITYTHAHATWQPGACPSPGSLPLIGAGSEPKLVPAGAVLQGGAIRSHETVPANQRHAPRALPCASATDIYALDPKVYIQHTRMWLREGLPSEGSP